MKYIILSLLLTLAIAAETNKQRVNNELTGMIFKKDYFVLFNEVGRMSRLLSKHKINYHIIVKKRLFTEDKEKMKSAGFHSVKRLTITLQVLRELAEANYIDISTYEEKEKRLTQEEKEIPRKVKENKRVLSKEELKEEMLRAINQVD